MKNAGARSDCCLKCAVETCYNTCGLHKYDEINCYGCYDEIPECSDFREITSIGVGGMNDVMEGGACEKSQ